MSSAPSSRRLRASFVGPFCPCFRAGPATGLSWAAGQLLVQRPVAQPPGRQRQPGRAASVVVALAGKRKKRGLVQEDESRAVDVFADVKTPAEDLLAAALGVEGAAEVTRKAKGLVAVKDEAGEKKQEKKKKKEKKKKGRLLIEDGGEQAVDVFGAQGMNQEDLLAAALGKGVSALGKGTSKEKSKDGQKKTAQSVKRAKKEGVVGDSVVHSGSLSANPAEKPTDVDEITEQLRKAKEVVQEETKEGEKEDFEVDKEVVSEFDTFSEQVSDFTFSGRQKSAKKERKKRAASKGKFGNVRYMNYGSGGEKFTSVRLEDVSVVFRNTKVLKSVTWEVKTGDRIGLVGQNGCGKTTQLKIIAGMLKPTSGEVLSSSKKTKAAFLKQEFVDELDPKRTLREEFMTCFVEENALLKEYNEIEESMAAAGDDLSKLEKLLNRLEEVRNKCDELDAWNLDARIDRVIPGLGFVPDDNERLVASFSGGWKVRIGLGKVLLQDPDLILLDEPTNHLDLESVEWLEEYLKGSSLPMVIVSHDREFMDRLCTKIVEIEGGEAFEYPGNYSRFLDLRAERRKSWQAAYERQQAFIEEQQNYIKRNRGVGARVKQVKSRERLLERLERTGQLVPKPHHGGKPLVFRFPPAPRSAQDVVEIEDLSHGYGEASLFSDVNLVLERGDRVAILGPNGAGKSTLLRLITGLEAPDAGKAECGSLHNVKIAYFEQNQADALDLDKTVLQTLSEVAPSNMGYEKVRALLGRFLFKGDSVQKKISALSGGEKARVALAKIMMEPANVLVLDEPTNHLDIGAKEMLEEALQHYDGTLVVVSHDRYFVSRVASQIIAIEDEELVLYEGDYKYYLEKQKAIKDKLKERYIRGLTEIKSAPTFVYDESAEVADRKASRKKNFGGSGVTSGRTKAVNAERWSR